ncbi:MAG: hypothetical protein A3G97_13300 [Candidatus Rokubacteria bacterium RIFCSPLOWO2_12_FULL_69_21]|nr:MAG: hypothetical protein A3G97_13300 [Candidatus Rokubacteria bacterium RIFCSPLOWO2_12_FULL_69_21]
MDPRGDIQPFPVEPENALGKEEVAHSQLGGQRPAGPRRDDERGDKVGGEGGPPIAQQRGPRPDGSEPEPAGYPRSG